MSDSSDPHENFYAAPTVEDVIAQQGKVPLRDPKSLLGDFWPEEEDVEEFLTALRSWRGHDRNDRAA